MNEGTNGPIPKMPFDQLCDLIAEAIKSVPSEKVIKTFKQTLLSLPIDGSRDEAEGSKRILRYIAGAPTLDQIPQKYRSHVTYTVVFFRLVKLRSMLTGFESEMLAQLKSTRIAYSNASFVVGLIRTNIRRKPRNMGRSAPLFGSTKIGSRKSLKL